LICNNARLRATDYNPVIKFNLFSQGETALIDAAIGGDLEIVESVLGYMIINYFDKVR